MCGIFAVITDNIKNSPLKNSNIINKAFEWASELTYENRVMSVIRHINKSESKV